MPEIVIDQGVKCLNKDIFPHIKTVLDFLNPARSVRKPSKAFSPELKGRSKHYIWQPMSGLALKESRLETIGSENCENLHPICVQKVWKYILETLKNFVPKMHFLELITYYSEIVVQLSKV